MTRRIRSLIALPALLVTSRLRIMEAQHHIAALTEQRDRAIDCAEMWKREAERLRDVAESRAGIVGESAQ